MLFYKIRIIHKYITLYAKCINERRGFEILYVDLLYRKQKK